MTKIKKEEKVKVERERNGEKIKSVNSLYLFLRFSFLLYCDLIRKCPFSQLSKNNLQDIFYLNKT